MAVSGIVDCIVYKGEASTICCMYNRVYETVGRLCVCLSVCPIDRQQQLRVAGLLLSRRQRGACPPLEKLPPMNNHEVN